MTTVSTAVVVLLRALDTRAGLRAEHKRASCWGRYTKARRESWHATSEHRLAADLGLIELHIYGRGAHRQAYWRLTETGAALVTGLS